jgi:ABC-type transporter MlaC component
MRTSFLRAAAAAFAMFGLFGAPALAQELDEAAARQFAETLVQDLRAVAGDEDAEDSQRVQRLRDVLTDALAMGPISRFMLGPALREQSAAADIERYETLFPSYIATSFAAEIDELAARHMEISGVVRRRANEVIVQSNLISSTGRTAASVDWRVRLDEGEPRLLDVLVERVSPMLTRREEIASLANRGGMAAILAHMESTIAEYSAG